MKKEKLDKKIILSFDVEEFDMPMEYGHILSLDEQLKISLFGLENLLKILEKYNITSTIYCTSVFAENNKNIIRNLSKKHEIASHTYNHSNYEKGDANKSKIVLEDIIKKEIFGIRMPRMQHLKNIELIGYKYNSSLNPCYIPNRYNNFNKPRTPFIEDGIIQFPTSVTPILRIPLFWISFHNFPLWIYNFLCKKTINKDNYLNIYFHPWEFSDLTKFNFPFFLKKNTGEKMVIKFERWIKWALKNNLQFCTTNDFLSKRNI